MTKPIHEQIKQRIIQRVKAGDSYRQISATCGVGYGTVQKIANKEFPSRIVPKKGRPSMLSEHDKRYCARLITSKQSKTAVEVQKMLEEEHNISVHVETVRKALHQMGLRAIKKPEKPLLSEKNAKARREWAMLRENWTCADWELIIWSDETKINRFGSDGIRYAWIHDGEPLRPHHVNMTVKHGGGSLMVWGCITARGVGRIVRIDGKLTQAVYKNLLNDHLLGTMHQYQLEARKVLFQQDNDPKHTAKSVREWLSRQQFGVLPWPAQSPDLNPIENIWDLLKRRLYSNYERPPSGMLELWERIQEVWSGITPEECQRVIQSMPTRCAQIRTQRGYWINY